MKIDRLLSIVTILLQREQVTAPELAERMEVSRRTIGRDIDALCRAGIPVITRQGGGGGISIAEGYKLDKSLLTREELQSILIGLGGLGTVDGRAGPLLEKLAPGPGKEAAVPDGVSIDLSSHYRDSLSPKISLFREAVRLCRRVEFDYYAPRGRTRRKVEPCQVVFQWNGWYLLAFCCLRDSIRLFKLNRLWNAALTGEPFQPRQLTPRERDLDARLEDKHSAEMLVHPSAEYILVESYGPDSYARRGDGLLHYRMDYSSREYALRWILALGDKVEVLSPPDLRREVRDRLGNARKRYDETAAPGGGMEEPMNCNLSDYAKPHLIEELCREMEMPGEVAARLARHAGTLDHPPLAQAFPGLFRLDTGAEAVKAVEEACRTGEDPTGDGGLRALAVFLAAALHTREIYREMGVEDPVYLDTMLAFRRFLLEHRESYGRYGFDRGFWIYRQLSAREFRLGALEFEICNLSWERGAVGPAQPGDPVLSVHIPSDAVMDRKSLDRSYRMGREFFARFFPDYRYRCACCNSWLLSPVLEEVLGPGSRIRNFREDYEIAWVEPEDRSAVGWVFKREYEDYKDLPEDTSLMRGLKSILLSGRSIGAAAGFVKGFEGR